MGQKRFGGVEEPGCNEKASNKKFRSYTGNKTNVMELIYEDVSRADVEKSAALFRNRL